ncbi:hypothetical protein WN55_08417 [Dufourea novaeangliae]|uniref:Uncharacterized protein n=1 Tax=Dufourea novaeangliae TaxID=178035 RepID=A0A154P6T3_DUFNO|nr:hypothetical protein WN55_08417 [Dufourea novaeangliae]
MLNRLWDLCLCFDGVFVSGFCEEFARTDGENKTQDWGGSNLDPSLIFLSVSPFRLGQKKLILFDSHAKNFGPSEEPRKLLCRLTFRVEDNSQTKPTYRRTGTKEGLVESKRDEWIDKPTERMEKTAGTTEEGRGDGKDVLEDAGKRTIGEEEKRGLTSNRKSSRVLSYSPAYEHIKSERRKKNEKKQASCPSKLETVNIDGKTSDINDFKIETKGKRSGFTVRGLVSSTLKKKKKFHIPRQSPPPRPPPEITKSWGRITRRNNFQRCLPTVPTPGRASYHPSDLDSGAPCVCNTKDEPGAPRLRSAKVDVREFRRRSRDGPPRVRASTVTGLRDARKCGKSSSPPPPHTFIRSSECRVSHRVRFLLVLSAASHSSFG